MSWALVKALGGRLLSLVPRQVWLVGLALLALSYFAHWNAERGRAEVELRIALEVAAERERVLMANQAAIDAANVRAREAELLAAQRAKELKDVYTKAHDLTGASAICVPGDIADGLRDLR